ncbi:TM2 domain-containing protein [Cyanobium sp. NIES-981]|uniref:TM2 domain-containing protein n=1 Tax=Cyanobium sp. NIES-981 TaxID=1851505 RepID=UPI0007DDB18B|nr:TM2 domain-containing protein [Cyanobium sp. NIES-981]SBO42455.1 TM2 domain protein [Cyanobium sp. NIES-981]
MALEQRRHLGMAYLLWALGLLGVCGVQRLYARKPWSGTLYLLTFGLCFIGQLVDLWLMPELVEQANTLPLLRRGRSGVSTERQLLLLARQRGERGFTINDAVLSLEERDALESEELRVVIERLLHAHLLDVGNDERGRVIYREP